METVLWPEIDMATGCETPARTMFRTAVRLKSWKSFGGTPAFLNAVAQAVR